MAEEVKKAKIATMWLSGCSGCHLSIADIHEAIIDVMGLADFEFSPVLMDVKYDEVPDDLDAIIIEGGIRNDENRELAEMLREKAKIVIAYGSCAVYGGPQGIANLFTTDELIEEAYKNSASTINPEGIIPSEDIPHLESRVRPLAEAIKVDLAIPGCPCLSEVAAQAILALLKGEPIELPNTNLCEVCPREKPPEGMAMDKIVRQFELGEPEPEMCLVPQGLICMGPSTISVCGAECPTIAIQCRGCYGPTTKVMDQGAKMISAIASDFGVERDKIVDPEEVADQIDDIVGTFYQFTLASALVPMKVQKEGK
jgi:F420-non-reducing hydrogenase small subunit